MRQDQNGTNKVAFDEPDPSEIALGENLLERVASLQGRVQNHIDHLASLTGTLQQLGLDATAIREHVSEISDEYQLELLRTINRMST